MKQPKMKDIDTCLEINIPPSLTTHKAYTGRPSKSQVENLIINYVTSEMRPISTVDKPSFKNLVQGLSGGMTPMCSKTFRDRLKERHRAMIYSIKEDFRNIGWVCTTADIWSCFNKSYMGMTAHYIDEDTLQRKSCVLACRRMRFSHTYYEIGQMLSIVHSEYDLELPKLVGTVTDNASNFGKAFRIFQPPENVDNNDLDFLNDESQSSMVVNEIPDLSGISDSEGTAEDFLLPTHFRCWAHSLNLIATRDSESALTHVRYKRVYNSAMGKACALWNALHRSTKLADYVDEICSVRLPIPCPTRWNSLFDSLSKVMSVKDHLPAICDKLEKPKFKSTDIDFITEYLNVMRPLAAALDKLQGEKDCFLGLVLPTLHQLKATLLKMTNLEHTFPLVTALLDGISKRFSNIMDLSNPDSRQYVISTLTIPMFKLRWLSISGQSERANQCKEMLLSEADKFSNQEMKPADGSEGSTDEDDFFLFLKDTVASDTSSNTSKIQILAFFEDLQSLHNYPIVKAIFLKYNTVLPSSAAVERAFSIGGQILTPRRNRLSDEMFEVMLSLKSSNHKV